MTRTQTEPPFVFHSRLGPLRVLKPHKSYRLDIPCLPPEPLLALPEQIEGIFEPRPVHVFRNFENGFADPGDAGAVRRFVPDLPAIARLGHAGRVVTGQAAAGDRADFVSRYFARGAGIPEDPVTGSIHATLVPYWANRLGRDKLITFQASRHGGWIECALMDDRVHLAGDAVTFMEASILLPADTAWDESA